RLGIDPAAHQLGLWAEDVRLSLPSGEPLATFPEMATSFHLGSLLTGWIEPTQLTVERPVLRLVRDENGAFTARIGSPEQSAQSGPNLSPGMLAQQPQHRPLDGQ